MSLYVNELGEFVTHEEDTEERRAKAYAGLRATPVRREPGSTWKGGPIPMEPKGFKAVRKCERCGAEYEARVHNQKYCSPKCSAAAHNERRRAR